MRSRIAESSVTHLQQALSAFDGGCHGSRSGHFSATFRYPTAMNAATLPRRDCSLCIRRAPSPRLNSHGQIVRICGRSGLQTSLVGVRGHRSYARGPDRVAGSCDPRKRSPESADAATVASQSSPFLAWRDTKSKFCVCCAAGLAASESPTRWASAIRRFAQAWVRFTTTSGTERNAADHGSLVWRQATAYKCSDCTIPPAKKAECLRALVPCSSRSSRAETLGGVW